MARVKEASFYNDRKTRLGELIIEKGYKNINHFADYLKEKYGSDVKGNPKISANSLRKYVCDDVDIPIEKAELLCTELNCSLDYLFRRSDCRSVDNQYIQDELGLSDDSINAIKHAAKHNDDDIKTFNFICNSTHGGKLDLHFLLSYIRSYITCEYTTPVQYDPISKKYFVPYWQEQDDIVLYARDKKHLQDVKGLPLSESISETITLKDIEKLLNGLKKIWNNKKG